MIKARYFRALYAGVVSLTLLLTSTVAIAVVRILNPSGAPVSVQSVTITLPGNIEKKGETDDDGILIWLDGSKPDNLPAGALISGGYSYSYVPATGMSTTAKVLIGAAVVGAGIAIADNGDSNSNSGGGSGEDPGETPDAALLEVTPSSLSITRTAGDPGCPVSMGSITVANMASSGGGSMTYTVSDAPQGFSYSANPMTVAPGGSEDIDVNFVCSPDESASGTVTIEGTDVDSDASAGTSTVELSATVSTDELDPGELSISTTSVNLGEHDPNSTPCEQPSETVTLSNTGGEPISVELSSSESFIDVAPTSITLGPGESVTITINFNCNSSSFSFDFVNEAVIDISVNDEGGENISDAAINVQVDVLAQ